MGRSPSRELYDCCTPRVTLLLLMVCPQRHRTLLHPFFLTLIAKQGYQAVATALFTRMSHRDTRSSAFFQRLIVAKVLTAENLFSHRSYSIAGKTLNSLWGKKEESSPDECENLKNSLDNLSKICYNKHIVGTRKKVVRGRQSSSDCLCVYFEIHTKDRVFPPYRVL